MISIVITGYKEPKTIGKAISQVLKNKIKESYELIVAAPDKETLDAARVYFRKNKKIKILKDEGRGKPSALNQVFKKAKGDIIIMTDADVHISENAIPYIINIFKDPKIGAVTGRPRSLSPRNKMLGFWSHLLTDIAHDIRDKRIKDGKMIVCSGYLYAIRRGIVKNIPDEALSEDAVISHMIYDKGYKILYAPEAEVYVKYPSTFSDWIKQKKRSAGGYNQLGYIVKKKERMRSFAKESEGIFKVLAYPKTIKEFIYTISLIFARIYLWTLIFWDINVMRKNLKKIITLKRLLLIK